MCTVQEVNPDLLFPSRFAEVADRPHLRELLSVQIDMQMDDLRSLLAMPMPHLGLTGGCNLTATMLLCNVAAGASMLLFEASLESVRGRQQDSGARFKEVLAGYYPWQQDDQLEPAKAANLLYGEMRNPLTHNLGVGKNRIAFPGLPQGDGRSMMLRKGPMPALAIERLLLPDAPPPGRRTITKTDSEWIVDVDMLTWGTYRLLRGLLGDPWQMEFAEETAQALVTGTPVTYESPVRHAAPSSWGEIASADDYDSAIGLGRMVVQVPARDGWPDPALTHDGTCGNPKRDKVLAHLQDGTAPRYYWAQDIEVARHAFRARRCLGEHRRP